MTRLPPFQRVLDDHGAALLRFCFAQAGPEHGEDVFQETVLAALRAYPQLRDAAAARGWLLTIAARTAAGEVRDAARRPRPSEAIEQLAGAAPPMRAPADPALLAQVRALPPKQRTALLLRIAGDLSHAEIAAAMGTSEDAARRNVHEALTRLRAAPPPRG